MCFGSGSVFDGPSGSVLRKSVLIQVFFYKALKNNGKFILLYSIYYLGS